MHSLYCKTRCHRQAGFTMLELMIAIGIIAILSAIAVLNIISWLPNYRLKAAARDMISNLQKTKMEAVKRNVTVVLDFVPASNMYEIFVDDGAGGGNANNFTRDGGETLLGTLPSGANWGPYNDDFRRRLLSTTVKCRNIGL